MLKSRIFLSCGQGPEERRIALKIKNMLEDKPFNFNVYVATEQHTSEDFKRNIFGHLENSEYFLFIDFKREKLEKKLGENAMHRGSLFSHQELALATFLEAEMLGFQEVGVEQHVGIMQFAMVNPIPFSNKEEVPDLVKREIKNAKWQTGWRRDLGMNFSLKPSPVREYENTYKPGIWFHLEIRNDHRFKQARNCTGFVVEVKGDSDELQTPELSELKWKGITIGHQVTIPPKATRKLDAFHIFIDSKCDIVLGANPYLVDATAISEQYTLHGPGTFTVTYRVYSDNFFPVERAFTIETCKGKDPTLKIRDENNKQILKLTKWPTDFTPGSTSSITFLTHSIRLGDGESNGSTRYRPIAPITGPEDFKIKTERDASFINNYPHVEAGTVTAKIPNTVDFNRKLCPKCGSPLNPLTNRCDKCYRNAGDWS